MSTFSWVLMAVGAYLVLHAALVLSRSGKEGEDKKKESLGCGFVVLAAAFWGIALARYLDDWKSGLQLGVAFALILPVVATLMGRRRGRVVASVVLLTIAVVLGAPALPKLFSRFKPTRSRITVQRVQEAVADLEGQISSSRAYIEKLAKEREALRTKVRALGFADFAAISKDPNGYALLKELEELDRVMATAQQRLEEQNALLPRMQAALRRITRMADAESTGVELDEKEIENVLEEARRKPVDLGPATVEEHVEREKLKKLFEGGL